jgi:hypothetical protein
MGDIPVYRRRQTGSARFHPYPFRGYRAATSGGQRARTGCYYDENKDDDDKREAPYGGLAKIYRAMEMAQRTSSSRDARL